MSMMMSVVVGQQHQQSVKRQRVMYPPPFHERDTSPDPRQRLGTDYRTGRERKMPITRNNRSGKTRSHTYNTRIIWPAKRCTLDVKNPCNEVIRCCRHHQRPRREAHSINSKLTKPIQPSSTNNVCWLVFEQHFAPPQNLFAGRTDSFPSSWSQPRKRRLAMAIFLRHHVGRVRKMKKQNVRHTLIPGQAGVTCSSEEDARRKGIPAPMLGSPAESAM